MKFPPSEFWSYSTDIYQRAEIERTCLTMQDQYQADVNILLYCCWVGEKQIELSEDDIATLIKISQPWQKNILMHLRAARATLKTGSVIISDEERNQTRDNICEMESNAEHMAQLALEKAINLKKKNQDKDLKAIDCTTNNLTLYCQQLEATSSIEQITTELTNFTEALYLDDDSSSQPSVTVQANV